MPSLGTGDEPVPKDGFFITQKRIYFFEIFQNNRNLWAKICLVWEYLDDSLDIKEGCTWPVKKVCFMCFSFDGVRLLHVKS